jgi:tetratricopeptide (TPR) repeat protein
MAEALVVIFIMGNGLLIFLIVRSLVAPRDVQAFPQLLKEGKTRTVVKSALAIIAKRPGDVEAHYYLGMAYLAEHRPELAFIELKTVNQLGVEGKNIPELDFRQLLAKLFLQNDQLEDALREYLLLTKLAPKQADFHYWAGRLYSSLDDTDMAIRYLNYAATLSPNDGKIHGELGAMLYKEKKNFEAKQELEKAITIQNDTAQAYFYLGKLQKDAEDYSTALTLFEQAQQSLEYRSKALLERGLCYMALRAENKAAQELELAVKTINSETKQDNLFARYFLGQCYEKQEQFDKALFQWEKIHEVKRNFKDVEAKLLQYADIRDENFKDFFTYNQENFISLCQKLVSEVLSLQVREISLVPDGCAFTAREQNDSGKGQPLLVLLYRMQRPVGGRDLVAVMEQVKRGGLSRAIVMSGSGFSPTALEYRSKTVELVDKGKLQELLRKVSQNKKGAPLPR